jgi:Raf kinase inhibitor-like YbhB/YbcL family protein
MRGFVTGVALLALTGGAQAAGTLSVRSPAFSNGGPIPMEYSCEGRGISPPIEWSGVPPGTRSIAVIVDDPDAPGGTFAHLALANLPPIAHSLPADLGGRGKAPQFSQFAINSKGEPGYSPICPPSGTHHYRFEVLALDQNLDLQPGASSNDLLQAAENHILARGTLTGTYQKGAR